MISSDKTLRTANFRNQKFIVNYKNEAHDISEFLAKHPGGARTLKGFNMKSIDEKFKNAEHSKAAEYLLLDYRVKKIETDFNNNKFDESLEHLVDWNLAMFPQIQRLGSNYTEWVNKPVDRKLRLFKNPVLELLTKTSWYLPLIFWLPIILFLVITESQSTNAHETIITLAAGLAFWTFLEYLLHRFVFHMDVNKHPKYTTFHFMLHGLHHKVPFDVNRLVFPPVPAAILATVIYQPLKALIELYDAELFNTSIALAGGLIGYLSYDMIHYYIHHGSPHSQYFNKLKRTHFNHHFVNHDRGFGISSPFWDFVFGTKIALKRLKHVLKR